MNKHFTATLTLSATTVLLAVSGWGLLFTQFMGYDDEGYVLRSLQDYTAHGHLYSSVYSQYGPFFYLAYAALHALTGITFDNETGRLLTLFYWCGTAAICGTLTWQTTARIGAAFAATVFTFVILIVMLDEPGHPGGMLAFLSALGALNGSAAIRRERWHLFAISNALIGTAMCLIKINTGVFFMVSASAWLGLHLKSSAGLHRALRLAVVLGGLISPLILMRALWPEPWVATYALLFSCGALGIYLQISRRQEWCTRGHMALFLAASLGVAATVVFLCHASGTNWTELWQGVVVAPLKHPLIYANPIAWPHWELGLALCSLGGAAWLARRNDEAAQPRLAIVCLVAGGFFLTTIFFSDARATLRFSFNYGPLLGWLVLALFSDAKGERRPLAWVAWVYVWQILQAYPVAGSQMGWGAFLWAPLICVGIAQASAHIESVSGKPALIAKITAGAFFISGFFGLAKLGSAASQRYFHYEPLSFPGTGALRLRDDQRSTFVVMQKNIREHGDMLFSYPGMFSWNTWTGLPTPSLANVTHWFSLLSNDQQQAIITRLAQHPGAVVLVQTELIQFLDSHGYFQKGPLRDYLMANFTSALRLNGYELWVHKGRTIIPISTADISYDATTHTLTAKLFTTSRGEIRSIEFRELHAPRQRILEIQPAQATRFQRLLLDDAGNPAAETRRPGAIPARHYFEITVTFPAPPSLQPLDTLEVFILDPDGKVLDRLRFRQ